MTILMSSNIMMSTVLVYSLLFFNHYAPVVHGFSTFPRPFHVCSLSKITRHENLRNGCLAALEQSDDSEKKVSDESAISTKSSPETTTLMEFEPNGGATNDEEEETEEVNTQSSSSYTNGSDRTIVSEKRHTSPEAPSPPLVFSKFLTMQSKRVNVTIRYTGSAGLRPFFLTIAKNIKKNHPDVIIERIILPEVEAFEDHTLTVIVDGKAVLGKDRIKWQNVDRSSMTSNDESDTSGGHYLANGMSVFVSMSDINQAISKARKKKRPNTGYGFGDEQDLSKDLSPREMKLEMLRKSRETKDHHRPLEE